MKLYNEADSICQVEKPTEWISNLTAVSKEDKIHDSRHDDMNLIQSKNRRHFTCNLIGEPWVYK